MKPRPVVEMTHDPDNGANELAFRDYLQIFSVLRYLLWLEYEGKESLPATKYSIVTK